MNQANPVWVVEKQLEVIPGIDSKLEHNFYQLIFIKRGGEDDFASLSILSYLLFEILDIMKNAGFC